MARIPSRGERVRRRKCGRCGETGHTRLRCPNPPMAATSVSSNMMGQDTESSNRRRIVHCSCCGEEGHTIRKCPTKVVVDDSEESVHF